MASRRQMATWMVLALIAAPLAGCGKSVAESIDETITLPIRGVRAGVREIGKGVRGVEKTGKDILGRLITDRNRAALVREHRDTLAHLSNVKKIIERDRTQLLRSEIRLIQDANDRLASGGLQLESPRISSRAGLSTYRQLEDVRKSLDLIRRRLNTPSYTGFIAVR